MKLALAFKTHANGQSATKPTQKARRSQLMVQSSQFNTSEAHMDRRTLLAGGVALIPMLAGASSPLPAFAKKEEECTDLKSTPSGLQFCDIKVGDGDVPVPKAFIKAHYEGRLNSENYSGVFDSSYERGKPLAFAIGTGQVIKGWDLGILGSEEEGIPGMRPGGKRLLVIPPELGYGARGAGGIIPPNATLYFTVEYVGRLGAK